MFVHPGFDPIALQFGPLSVRWYGLMYLVGFVVFMALGRWRIRQGLAPVTTRQLDDLLFAAVLGVVVGGRLGYVLFYQPAWFLAHPWEVFAVWQGGMSFHGGLLGVVIAVLFFSRRQGIPFLHLADFVAPLVPLGLAAGRLGNFLNAELWGRPTDLPWGMVFPTVDALPRHPSQLYEMALEGLLLFVVLWWFSMVRRPAGAVAGLFLALYGGLRFLVEFTREPDAHLGLLGPGLSMGQWLSLPMVVAGIALLLWCRRAGKS